MAKIKLPKLPHGVVIFLIKVRRFYRDLSSQADPIRENFSIMTNIQLSQEHNNTCMKHSYEI